VGDLTGAFNFAAAPDASAPSRALGVVPNRADPRVLTECITTGTAGTLAGPTQPIVMDPTITAAVALPTQERAAGPVLRPSGACAAAVAPGPLVTAVPPPASPAAPARALPATGRLPGPSSRAIAAVAIAGGLAASWRRRRLQRPE
jgi:hypothetical protein